MRKLIYLLFIALLSSCLDKGYKDTPILFSIIIKNKSTKEIYLKKYLNNLSTETDTLKISNQINFSYLGLNLISSEYFKNVDSVLVNFDNERYRLDNSINAEKDRNLFNPLIYKISSDSSVYTFTQADYDAATPF